LNSPKANNNVTTVQFDVFEPYSLGVFMLALQTAANKLGYSNWRDAPYLLTLEFRGNKENGQIMNIPNATRHIPIKLTNIAIKASEQGTTYNISAYATQGQAATTQFSDLRTDVSIKGKTVQELLQTGEQSLQSVVNKKLKEYETDGTVKKADEIIILFPTDISSAASPASSNTSESASTSATTSTATSSSASPIYKKLGVVTSTINATAVQRDDDCNELGKASMGYGPVRKGDQQSSKESSTWNPKTGVWARGNIEGNINEGMMRFAQKTDISTVINQVLLMSTYPGTALADAPPDAEGMRKWWRIDTQVYYINSKENVSKTGTFPRLIVYRVIPYRAHTSTAAAPGIKAPGFSAIEQNVVKRYDYLYTGKNSEVLKFDIDFSVSFANVLAADDYKRSTDIKRNGEMSGAEDKQIQVGVPTNGVLPEAREGVNTTQSKQTGLLSWFDKMGGGGQEDATSRAAKTWHKAITNPVDMVVLDLEIVGDPFWFVQSGQGNYTAKPHPTIKDLNNDGTVNWQSSEVDLLVNFRSPLDINQATGLYDFKGTQLSGSSSSVISWSGLYRITLVTSSFKGGVFTQKLQGNRRPLQEAKKTATPSQTFNVSQPPDPTVTKFDDGSSIQQFDDGSTLATDANGNVSSSPASI